MTTPTTTWLEGGQRHTIAGERYELWQVVSLRYQGPLRATPEEAVAGWREEKPWLG